MKLTREEAIEKHRALWREIARDLEENPSDCTPKIKEAVLARLSPNDAGLVLNNCYLCHYAEYQSFGTCYRRCHFCPLNKEVSSLLDECLGGLWLQFNKAILRYNIEEAIRLAKEIAELPERSDSEEEVQNDEERTTE